VILVFRQETVGKVAKIKPLKNTKIAVLSRIEFTWLNGKPEN
jgi:hypothetical protein